MKCPLSIVGEMAKGGEFTGASADCMAEKCAWWYENNQCCAILTLAQGSVYLHKVLLNLDSKIPLGGAK